MDPQQFFLSLSNNDIETYNKLLTFSKQFLTESLTKDVTWLFGCGCNGKTTLMTLLLNLVNNNKVMHGVDYKYNLKAFNETLRYCIIEEFKGSNFLDQVDKVWFELFCGDEILVYGDDNVSKLVKPNIKFIIMTNKEFNGMNQGFARRTQLIKMPQIFNSNNRCNDISNQLLSNKETFREFILKYKMDIVINKHNIITDDSETETDNTLDKNVLEINEIELTKKETFYYQIIDKYYKTLSIKKIETMIDIIEGKSKISLRLLDWFITRYANKYKIRFERINNKMIDNDPDDKFDSKIDNGFNVHISYKAQLKSYKKKYFDPFRRRKKFRYYFDKDKTISLCTTIGQLNFFRWAFTNYVIEYVAENYNAISKAMVTTNKADKTRKIKEINQKDNNATNQSNKLTVKKNGVSISAKKKIKNDDVKIILSFD